MWFDNAIETFKCHAEYEESTAHRKCKVNCHNCCTKPMLTWCQIHFMGHVDVSHKTWNRCVFFLSRCMEFKNEIINWRIFTPFCLKVDVSTILKYIPIHRLMVSDMAKTQIRRENDILRLCFWIITWKEKYSPAGNCKRRAARGITCPSAIQSRTRWVPLSSPDLRYPFPDPIWGYPDPVPDRGYPLQSWRGYPLPGMDRGALSVGTGLGYPPATRRTLVKT